MEKIIASRRVITILMLLAVVVVMAVVMTAVRFANRGTAIYSLLLPSDLYSTRAHPPFNGTLAEAGQFYTLLRQVEEPCTKLVRMGGHTCNRQPRAYSELCMEERVRPPTNSCVVYTFGQDEQLSFEESVLFDLNCTVHMFDPSVDAEYPIPIYLSGSDFHHPVGARAVGPHFVPSADRSNIEWRVVEVLLKEYRPLHPTVHVMRISLHGAEWEALQQFKSMGLMDRVEQLSVDLHTLHLKGRPSEKWLQVLQSYQDSLQQLHLAGLRKVSYHEDVGNLALVQMPNEDLPRQACGRALYVRGDALST